MAFRRIDTDVSVIPEGGPAKRWGWGVAGALLVCLFGLLCIVTRRADGWGLADTSSALFGLTLVWLASVLHFRYFWGLSTRLRRYCEILQGIALLALVGTLAVFVILALVGGFA